MFLPLFGYVIVPVRRKVDLIYIHLEASYNLNERLYTSKCEAGDCWNIYVAALPVCDVAP